MVAVRGAMAMTLVLALILGLEASTAAGRPKVRPDTQASSAVARTLQAVLLQGRHPYVHWRDFPEYRDSLWQLPVFGAHNGPVHVRERGPQSSAGAVSPEDEGGGSKW
jgi:hypothetical protein